MQAIIKYYPLIKITTQWFTQAPITNYEFRKMESLFYYEQC